MSNHTETKYTSLAQKPSYTATFTPDYNASFIDARKKYITDYMQIETTASRWYNLYN